MLQTVSSTGLESSRVGASARMSATLDEPIRLPTCCRIIWDRSKEAGLVESSRRGRWIDHRRTPDTVKGHGGASRRALGQSPAVHPLIGATGGTAT